MHFLGLKHANANFERQIDELKFPNASKYRIISDIFGEVSAIDNADVKSKVLKDVDAPLAIISNQATIRQTYPFLLKIQKK